MSDFKPSHITAKQWQWAFIAIIGCYALLRIYLLISMPLSIDEAATYNSFTTRSLPYAALHYPAPNNHVLHSLFTRLFYAPGPWQKYLLRLPAFFFGIGALLLFARLSWQRLSPLLALAALAIFGAMEPILYYGYMARGYALVLFFALATTFLLLRPGLMGLRRGILVVICTALGIYSVPFYLYFGLAIAVAGSLWIWQREARWQELFKWGLALAGGLVLAIVLYLPIIINDGLNAIVANGYVSGEAGVSLAAWGQHFQEVSFYYLKGTWILPVLFVFAIVQALWRLRINPLALLSIVVLAMMLVMPLLHGVLPFSPYLDIHYSFYGVASGGCRSGLVW